MKDVNRDPVRWERSMTQDKEGQYVAFHDYALLLDAHDTLRARLSEAQARMAEIEKQEPVLECHSTRYGAWRKCARPDSCTNSKRAVYAAPVAPAAQAVADDMLARWCEYATRMRVRGQPTPQPLLGETLALLAAQQQKVKP